MMVITPKELFLMCSHNRKSFNALLYIETIGEAGGSTILIPLVSANMHQAPIPALFTYEKNLTHWNFNGSTSAHKKSILALLKIAFTQR